MWFRNDLRVHDNESLYEAVKAADEVLPVYIFDPRILEATTSFGFPKTGQFQRKFLIESVAALKDKLKTKYGVELLIRTGLPELIIPELAGKIKSIWVFCNRERTTEEVLVQDQVEKSLWTIGQEMRFSRGKMLFYTADLPFPVTHTPDAFSLFRKEVQALV